MTTIEAALITCGLPIAFVWIAFFILIDRPGRVPKRPRPNVTPGGGKLCDRCKKTCRQESQFCRKCGNAFNTPENRFEAQCENWRKSKWYYEKISGVNRRPTGPRPEPRTFQVPPPPENILVSESGKVRRK